LRVVCGSFDLPVIAIGGINHQNASGIIRAGAHGIAVISSVCCQDDPEEAARRFCDLIAKG
jgi:thiamine monophosphate synthase